MAGGQEGFGCEKEEALPNCRMWYRVTGEDQVGRWRAEEKRSGRGGEEKGGEWGVERGGGRRRPPLASIFVAAASLLMMASVNEAAWTDQSTLMSVMTGSASVYPGGSTVGNVKLPATLQQRYKQPDSFHPNLRSVPPSFQPTHVLRLPQALRRGTSPPSQSWPCRAMNLSLRPAPPRRS